MTVLTWPTAAFMNPELAVLEEVNSNEKPTYDYGAWLCRIKADQAKWKARCAEISAQNRRVNQQIDAIWSKTDPALRPVEKKTPYTLPTNKEAGRKPYVRADGSVDIGMWREMIADQQTQNVARIGRMLRQNQAMNKQVDEIERRSQRRTVRA